MRRLRFGLSMNRFTRVWRWKIAVLTVLLLVASLSVTSVAAATSWRVGAGAESQDMAIQAAYFFSREITINAGDTVTWSFQTGEPHSVDFFDGTGSGGSIDSGIQAKGAPDFRLTFNEPGDYQYVCDIHSTMTGVVHVQATGSAYPHDQAYYDTRSQSQRGQALAEGLALRAKGLAAAAQQAGTTDITAGIGATHATGAVYVLRFLKPQLTIKVGDTVTWRNLDPDAPHTLTLNLDYQDIFQAIFPVGLDQLGPPGHATFSSTTQQVNTGFLWANPFPGLPPVAYRGTVFQAKFTKPGTYSYHCELHDTVGMIGTITVSP